MDTHDMDTVLEFHAELHMKDLPKVHTWRLGQDSNLQPFGRKTLNLPMRPHDYSIDTVSELTCQSATGNCE